MTKYLSEYHPRRMRSTSSLKVLIGSRFPSNTLILLLTLHRVQRRFILSASSGVYRADRSRVTFHSQRPSN